MIHDTLVPGHEYTVFSLPPISAWALLFGGKDIESRAWSTEQRGRVLIYASNEAMSLRESHARRAELCFLSGLAPSELPTIFARGAILGSIELVDCIEDARSKWAVPGRYHWVLGDPRPLRAPLAVVSGEVPFFSWRHEPKATTPSDRRRAPAHSGIQPALRAPHAELVQRTSTARRRGA